MSDLDTELPPRKQDAIHRALLTGLLGNVGVRADRGEYNGVRGKKFHLFPGSTLFRFRPAWVTSAELVETSKLYARTLAAVHPLWIERAAAHMVKRTYADPHWRADLGRVLAFEKVTLHGLTLISRRKVHFGPLEPKLAREILIHHALVLGEYESDAPWFLHNRRLVEEVQSLEAKARRRDVLVDPKARFAFYDARVPQRVYTADEFERWRRLAEKHNPQILFMSRADLMLHPALGVTEELYPDSMLVNGSRFLLEYRYEPGDRADGITVTVPLAMINQLPAEPFEWLVPGFRAEKFLALIRTLPKTLRVKFIPGPDYASAAARELKPTAGPVRSALAEFLGKASGEPVAASDFQLDLIPAHLRMNFRVVDSAGNELAMGRDLEALRRELGVQARVAFSHEPPPEFHRDGITHWDFGDLPPRVEIRRGENTLNGYPALVDAGESVSLRLFDAPQTASDEMRAGLRRLFLLQLGSELANVERDAPDFDRLGQYYAPIGSPEELKTDLTLKIADRAFIGDEPDAPVRTREAFAERAGAAWDRLPVATREVIALVEQILETFHSIGISLSNEFPPLWLESIRDLRDQLAHLVYRGFLLHTPYEALRNLPRYLHAMQIRLHKLGNAGLNRDLQALGEIDPLWRQYKLRSAEHHQNGTHDPALEQYRWMLEELRVSLFAQELKSAGPVSAQRLSRLWSEVKPG